MPEYYVIDIGEWDKSNADYEEIRGLRSMRVFSRVQLVDETAGNDPWVNDGFLEKIGDGKGTWTLLPSQNKLFLWGEALEYQAHLVYKTWPLKQEDVGEVVLKNGIYYQKKLAYWVSRVNIT